MLAISKSIVANNTDNNNNTNNQDGCCSICSGFNNTETEKEKNKDNDTIRETGIDTGEKPLHNPNNNVNPIQSNIHQQNYQYYDNIDIDFEPRIQSNTPEPFLNTNSEINQFNRKDISEEINTDIQQNTNSCIYQNSEFHQDNVNPCQDIENSKEENQENIEEKNEYNIENNEKNLRNEEEDNNENIENERSCDNFEEGGEGDEEEGGEEEYRNIREIGVEDTIEKEDNDPKYNNGTED